MEDFVSHLLSFLSPKFHNIRRFIWDHPVADQTLDDVRNTLLDHESQTSLETLAVETAALTVTTKSKASVQKPPAKSTQSTQSTAATAGKPGCGMLLLP